MRAPLWLPIGLAIAAAGATTLLARRITQVVPTRRREALLAINHDTVTLASTGTTRLPGHYALIDPSTGVHAQIGAIIDDDGTQVIRELINTTGSFTPGPVRWSGVYHSTPSQVGRYRTVEIAAPSGELDGWIFNEEARSSTWAIHIHGQGATPHSALRGVPASTRAGLTSLVAPFYGDDRTAEASHRTTFGVLEGNDVLASIELARRAGARDVVLIGWSLGAQVALELTRAVGVPARALVLVDPPLSWRRVLEHHRRRARFIPRALFLTALGLIQAPILHRAAGIPTAVRFGQDFLNRSMARDIPTLVVTSNGDQDIPAAHLERFAQLNACVRVERFPRAPHTMEWNRDVDRWEAIVTEFCARHTRAGCA